MAGASLLALIDDIASILDDVALMTKVAAKKTAGVLGDDLALNAEQVNGVRAERELPVVWAVAVGSLKNKLILVPAALAISAILPQAIVPLLMIGGLYLCFEGVEKLAHKFLHTADEDHAQEAQLIQAMSNDNIDLVVLEKEKITGAIRTDFVLSAEIIVIALGTVDGQPFMTQLAVLAGIGLIMTIGVYGIVAGIVKLDDIGFYLLKKSNSILIRIGRGLVAAAPMLMKALTYIGTAAMFLVGGGILTHSMTFLHHGIEGLRQESAAIASLGPILHAIVPSLADLLVGLIAGTLTLIVVQLATKLRAKK